jgi:acetyl-CoA acetyltransferase
MAMIETAEIVADRYGITREMHRMRLQRKASSARGQAQAAGKLR